MSISQQPSRVQEAVADGKICPMTPDECERSEVVEPEIDGEHMYYECPDCGYAWGYQRVEGLSVEGNCAIGVPEEVRREASAPMEQAMRKEQQKQPVSLGSTIPVRKD